MSRDWTPQEQYEVDKHLRLTQGRSMRDQEFFLVKPDGTKIPMEDNAAKKIRKQYKELGFLYDMLPKVYEEMKEHPIYRNRILTEIESHLEHLTLTGRGLDNDTIWLWYTGRLDSNFYYREYNNELFEEFILEEYNKLVHKRR